MEQQPAASLDTQTHAFEFSGNGKEYFKIWIVNLCLTIITVGIYSAWAKVRNTQYFYGNTHVNNAVFQYLAKPMVILKGRLIAVAVFVAYGVTANYYPVAEPIFFIALFALTPFVIVRSLRFRMRNTAYRNIRFNFTGSYGEAALVFLLLPIAIPLTLGIMYPYWQRRSKQFIVNNTAYGTSSFKLNCDTGPFIKVFIKMFGLMFLAGLLVVGVSVIAPKIGPFVTPLLMFLVYSYGIAYVTATITNIVFNHTNLNQHSFESDLNPNSLFKIYLTNGIAVAFSLGLFIPWALVRLANYRAQCTQLNAVGDLDNFIAAEQRQVSALGEEFGEVFDFDVGL